MTRTETNWSENFKRAGGEFFGQELVKEILRVNQAVWVANPGDGRRLDIAFKPRRAKRGEFAGVPIFQREKCIGVVFCGEGERENVEAGLLADKQTGELIGRGAEVAVMTEEELAGWGRFYKQIAQDGTLAWAGERALDFSGLRRLAPDEYERLLADAGGFFTGETEDWLKRMRVKEVVTEGLGQIDIAFLDRRGDRMVVPVSHVRVGKMQGEILVEEVVSEPVWVPGVIMRRPGENKREAYERANSLARYYKNRFGEKMRVEFPVVSFGQLSLWRKLGIGEPLEANLPEAGLKAEEVIRFLYLGESNVRPGELARMGFSLPGGGSEFTGLDVVFYNRDERGNRQFVAADGFLGLSLQEKKLGREGLEGLGNVKGIVIMPDGWNARKMHEHTKLILRDFNYRTKGAGGFLLYLTPSLFAEWQKRGSAFLGNGEINGEERGLERKVEYGLGAGNLRGVELKVVRLRPEIGSQKSAVVEAGQGENVWHLMDWGSSFAGNGRAFQEITAQEPTAGGIRRSLEIGALPMIPGIYDIEHILASVKGNFKVGYATTKDAVTSFLRAELVRWSSFEEVKRVAGGKVAQGVFKYGVEDERHWYGKAGQQVAANILASHGHVDHIGMMTYLRRDGRLLGSAETLRHILARGAKGTWRSRADRTTLVTQAKNGAAYQVIHREMVPVYWNDQRVKLSPNLYARFYFVDHSIGGTTMIGIEEAGGQGLVLYTADLRPGEQTSKAVQLAAGRYPVIMAECTNIEDGFKPSTGVTEETVKRTLQRIVKRAGNDTLVAIIPPNHLKRLETIMEIADGSGRTVAIDPSIAEVVEQLRIEKEMIAPTGADGFKEYLPKLGEEVALWWPPTTTPKPYRKILGEKAVTGSLGVVNGERLSRQGPELLVVTTPYRLLRDDFGGVSYRNGLEVIYMSFYPYQDSAKYRLGANLAWVNEVNREQIRGKNGAKMFLDFDVHGEGGWVDAYTPNYSIGAAKQGLHASGHATFAELVEIIDALEGRKNILVHGDRPVNFAADLQKRLGRKIEVISRLDRYDPAKPISQPGFSLRLD